MPYTAPCLPTPRGPSGPGQGNSDTPDQLTSIISNEGISSYGSIRPSPSTCAKGASDDESGRARIVRKNSGQIVRPTLRPPSRRHSSPDALIRPKSVHFDTRTDIRHFFLLDQPLAVNTGSSPAECYESDEEYFHFDTEERRSPQHELGIIMTALPAESPLRHALPVRLERVWLSNDQKSLLGSVAVANLAFEKYVTCRFTLDSWMITSDVAAVYTCKVPSTDDVLKYERFIFTVELSDVVDLESKTLYFCLRYNVDGQEFWDNNNGSNFQMKFRRMRPTGKAPDNLQTAFSGRPRPPTRPLQMSGGPCNPGPDQALSDRCDLGAALIATVWAAKSASDDRDVLRIKHLGKAGSRERVQPTVGERESGINSASYAHLVDKYCFVHLPNDTKSPNW